MYHSHLLITKNKMVKGVGVSSMSKQVSKNEEKRRKIESQRIKIEQQKTNEPLDEQTLAGPEGPIIDKESRNDVVSDQDEVDDLLSSLGF